MQKTTVYSPKEWDNISKIPLIHMTYVMQLLLPRRHIGRERLQADKEKVLAGCSPEKLGIQHSLKIVPVGSKSEGYGIPDAVRLTGDHHVEFLSDIDVMLVKEEFQAGASEFKEDGTQHSVFIETNQTHPGYGRVRLIAPKVKDSPLIFRDDEANKYYISSYMLMKEQYNQVKDDPDDIFNYLRQGPAISTEDSHQLTLQRAKGGKIYHPYDYVIAIPCEAWPDVAVEWTQRKRHNGWLTPDIIKEIVSCGCHMVPVAHRHSNRPEIEWRLSFAKAEELLARKAVTSGQRQCLIYVKMLRLQLNMKKLSSYCLKNVFLHCCDELPTTAWDNDPAGCVIYMIDILIECIDRRHLPGYFLPKNNLIDQLENQDFDEIKSSLETMRNDPLSPIIDFSDFRVFILSTEDCISYKTSFRDIVQPIMNDILSRSHLQTKQSNLGCFLDVQCIVASVMLNEKRSSFYFHLDFYQIFIQKYFQTPFLDLIIYIGIKLNSAFLTLMFYEKCLKEVTDFPELENLRGDMGCMCFSLARTCDEQWAATMRLGQAERIFEEAVRKSGVYHPSTIDYSNLLCYTEKWNEVINLLEEFIESDEKKRMVMANIYHKVESPTLNEQIKKEVLYSGYFEANSRAFAYYFLIKAYLKLDTTKVKQVLRKFLTYCQSAVSYGNFELLGYSGVDTRNYFLAERAFSKAIVLTRHKSLAEENVASCKSKIWYHRKKNVFKYILIIGNILDNNLHNVCDILFQTIQ
ncbi:unnamed protein product [Mytilus coruscus]|uniref:Uncharacterized protein n=1 Tax=Mytilus coruscus TaxID=42192 RepID=A0A6J8CI91_MYTCO|nr:unnamed protein product [Mytilus coruscus]